MEKRFDRLEEKLDKLSDQMNELNITMARNTESLIVHEKRTDLSEQRIEYLENDMLLKQQEVQKILEEMKTTIQPIREHVQLINVIFKYVLPVVSAVSAFAWKIFSFYSQSKQ